MQMQTQIKSIDVIQIKMHTCSQLKGECDKEYTYVVRANSCHSFYPTENFLFFFFVFTNKRHILIGIPKTMNLFA